MGWSGDWFKNETICASRPASTAASDTIFWNKAGEMWPEQEKVRRWPSEAAALGEQFHGQEIDIFVTAGRLFHRLSGCCKLGGVKDDEIEGLPHIPEFS